MLDENRIPFEVILSGQKDTSGYFEPESFKIMEFPKISCLMVTKGGLFPAKLAIECFLKQTYPNKELLIITDGNAADLADFVSGLENVKLFTSAKNVLGDLRNEIVSLCSGEYFCQWDDDDLYDDRRIEWMYKILSFTGSAAAFLSRWTMWWPAKNKIAISYRRIWEGSMLIRRGSMPVYPSLKRAEDAMLIKKIKDSERIVLLDAHRLYCYIFHGHNTWPDSHFNELLRHSSQYSAYEEVLADFKRRLPISSYLHGLDMHNTSS